MSWGVYVGICVVVFIVVDISVCVALGISEARCRRKLLNIHQWLSEYGDNDIHKPLTQWPFETYEEFVQRVQGALANNKITPNAARRSLGLPPLNGEGGGAP